MAGNTLYIEKDSSLHRLHPLTKLSVTLFCLICAFTLPDLLWLLAVYLVILLPPAALGGLLRPFLKSCVTVMTPFVISLTLIQGFFTGGETILLEVGRFAFTAEGALAGLTAAARILLALGGALLLMLSTRPDRLMLAFTQRGLPNSLAYIVLTALQIFPSFQKRAQVILEAQQARGLETKVGVVGRMRLLLPLTGPLVLSSIVDVEARAMALEARAFSRPGRKTSLQVLYDSRGQRIMRFGLIVLSLGLIAARMWLIFYD
ncbi:MAG: energy-coupling factor transporter transmembrane component T [Anaerolineales bacterium]